MARNATETFDGLTVGYGTHSSDNEVGAVISGNGVVQIRKVINGADLVDTFAEAQASPQEVTIPRGSIITRATFQVLTAFVGANATIDIGTWSRGLATEVVDVADGLAVDLTIAELTTVGETNLLAGALIADGDGGIGVGAVSNSDVIISASYETAAVTAGVGLLVVEYTAPFGPAGRTIAV